MNVVVRREDLLLSRVSFSFLLIPCPAQEMTDQSVEIRGSTAQATAPVTTTTFETSREEEEPQVSQLSGEGRADLVFTLRENEL